MAGYVIVNDEITDETVFAEFRQRLLGFKADLLQCRASPRRRRSCSSNSESGISRPRTQTRHSEIRAW